MTSVSAIQNTPVSDLFPGKLSDSFERVLKNIFMHEAVYSGLDLAYGTGALRKEHEVKGKSLASFMMTALYAIDEAQRICSDNPHQNPTDSETQLAEKCNHAIRKFLMYEAKAMTFWGGTARKNNETKVKLDAHDKKAISEIAKSCLDNNVAILTGGGNDGLMGEVIREAEKHYQTLSQEAQEKLGFSSLALMLNFASGHEVPFQPSEGSAVEVFLERSKTFLGRTVPMIHFLGNKPFTFYANGGVGSLEEFTENLMYLHAIYKSFSDNGHSSSLRRFNNLYALDTSIRDVAPYLPPIFAIGKVWEGMQKQLDRCQHLESNGSEFVFSKVAVFPDPPSQVADWESEIFISPRGNIKSPRQKLKEIHLMANSSSKPSREHNEDRIEEIHQIVVMSLRKIVNSGYFYIKPELLCDEEVSDAQIWMAYKIDLLYQQVEDLIEYYRTCDEDCVSKVEELTRVFISRIDSLEKFIDENRDKSVAVFTLSDNYDSLNDSELQSYFKEKIIAALRENKDIVTAGEFHNGKYKVFLDLFKSAKQFLFDQDAIHSQSRLIHFSLDRNKVDNVSAFEEQGDIISLPSVSLPSLRNYIIASLFRTSEAFIGPGSSVELNLITRFALASQLKNTCATEIKRDESPPKVYIISPKDIEDPFYNGLMQTLEVMKEIGTIDEKDVSGIIHVNLSEGE